MKNTENTPTVVQVGEHDPFLLLQEEAAKYGLVVTLEITDLHEVGECLIAEATPVQEVTK